MFRIAYHTLTDLVRGKWFSLMTLFFFLTAAGLFYFSTSFSKAILSVMHISIFVLPLLASLISSIYYYSMREYLNLLLAMPLRRTTIFLGQYWGLSLAVALAYLAGNIIPFGLYGIWASSEAKVFLLLLLNGIFISFIFVGISLNICLLVNDKIVGFGVVIIALLYFTGLYDGLVLLLFLGFQEYPVERAAVFLIFLNPIDLARISVLLHLDVGVLMGYTGAVLKKFLGSGWGQVASQSCMVLWIGLNVGIMREIVKRKDF